MQNTEDNQIFIDADALVALYCPHDAHYFKAIVISKHIELHNIQLVTSNFAIGEAITVISEKTSHKIAVEFSRKVYGESGEVMIIDVNRKQQLITIEKFSQATSKNVRFTDYINMTLMDELNIDTVFSFDKHYLQAGYKLLSI